MNPEMPQSPTPAPTPQPIAPTTSAVVSGSKTMAIVALVLAILGFLTGFILIGVFLAIAAVIMGIIGLVKHKPGKGLFIASVIIAGFCLITAPAVILISYNGVVQRANQAKLQSEQQSGN